MGIQLYLIYGYTIGINIWVYNCISYVFNPSKLVCSMVYLQLKPLTEQAVEISSTCG